jgi:hypothetical protein
MRPRLGFYGAVAVCAWAKGLTASRSGRSRRFRGQRR